MWLKDGYRVLGSFNFLPLNLEAHYCTCVTTPYTNVWCRYSNLGTGTGTVATAFKNCMNNILYHGVANQDDPETDGYGTVDIGVEVRLRTDSGESVEDLVKEEVTNL